MGIVNLNRFLIDNCKKSSICKYKLSYLKNKTIAIDTSIYMYKYQNQNALLENFYSMVSLFRQYNITPFFVFDGKPPPEKLDLLKERREEKILAETQYNTLMEEYEGVKLDLNKDQKKEFLNELEVLKTKFTRLHNKDINDVKTLFQLYGVEYIEANGEADAVCAGLVMSGKAWACMSDDMDMFVYGCPRVIRHFSLTSKNVLFYNLEKILVDLRMDLYTFRQITVLSGTDYNIKSNTSLYETMKWYEKYVLSKDTKDFYNWLLVNSKYIENYSSLTQIYNMFLLKQSDMNKLMLIDISLKEFDNQKLREFMCNDGFIFLNTKEGYS